VEKEGSMTTYRLSSPDYTIEIGATAARGTYVDIWVNPSFQTNAPTIAIDQCSLTVEKEWYEQMPDSVCTQINAMRDLYDSRTFNDLTNPRLDPMVIADLCRRLGFPGVSALLYRAHELRL
jgi:hypothetical protein